MRLPGSRGGLGITALSCLVDSAFLSGFAAAWECTAEFFSDANVNPLNPTFDDIASAVWNVRSCNPDLSTLPVEIQGLITDARQARTMQFTKLFANIPLGSVSNFPDLQVFVRTHISQVIEPLSSIKSLQHLLTKLVHTDLYDAILRTISQPNTVVSRYQSSRFLSQVTSEAMLRASVIPSSKELVIPAGIFRILFASAVGLPLPGFSRFCHASCSCGASLGNEGYHLLSCYRTYAHDRIVRRLNAMCRQANISSEVEPVGVLSGERRPDLLAPNLHSSGATYLLDFATVDPTRSSSIGESWYSPGVAAIQRENEKIHSYDGHFDSSGNIFIPLAIEISGRMAPKFKQFIREVASHASRHLPTGGVGKRRFLSRFSYFWKSSINVEYLKSLAYSALQTQRQIVDRLPNNQVILFSQDIF